MLRGRYLFDLRPFNLNNSCLFLLSFGQLAQRNYTYFPWSGRLYCIWLVSCHRWLQRYLQLISLIRLALFDKQRIRLSWIIEKDVSFFWRHSFWWELSKQVERVNNCMFVCHVFGTERSAESVVIPVDLSRVRLVDTRKSMLHNLLLFYFCFDGPLKEAPVLFSANWWMSLDLTVSLAALLAWRFEAFIWWWLLFCWVIYTSTLALFNLHNSWWLHNLIQLVDILENDTEVGSLAGQMHRV